MDNLPHPSVECSSKSILGDERLPWLTGLAEELLVEQRLEDCAGCGQSHLGGGQGLAPELAEFLLQRWNRKCCHPPLPADDVSRIVADVAAVVLQRLRGAA
jgi:hypothetical protein